MVQQNQKIEDLIQKYIVLSKESKEEHKSISIDPKFQNTFYSAFDIETVNLELTPDEQLKYLGEPSSIELVSSACNTADDILTPYLNKNRIVQIPVMIAYTKIINFKDRAIFSTLDDMEKCLMFEIENPNVSNSDVIEQSIKMMQNFWKSIHNEVKRLKTPKEEKISSKISEKQRLKDIREITKHFKGYDKAFLTKELKKGDKSKFLEKVENMINEKNNEISLNQPKKKIKIRGQNNEVVLSLGKNPWFFPTKFFSKEEAAAKSKVKPTIYFFAHNLGRYDGIFILKSFLQCEAYSEDLFKTFPQTTFKDNKLVRMKIAQNIFFLDSLQIMNSSLDSIAKTMLGKSKIDTGYKTFSKDLLIKWYENKNEWQEFRNYLARDCSLLIDILHKLADLFYNTYKFILGQKATISGTAVYIFFNEYYTIEKGLQEGRFRSFFKNSTNTDEYIYAVTGEQDVFIRKAFFGGRTEVFETFTGQNHYYDINSAYCAAMVEYNMPTGRPIGPYKVEDPYGFNKYEFDNFFGFMYATVFSPPDIDPPVLPYRSPKGNTLYPRGVFSGYFFSEQAKLAKNHGYQIMVHETIGFKPNNKLFKDFITTTYNERLKHPKNSAENLFFKIIMLSVYGRFALNPESTSYVFGDKEDFLSQQMDQEDYQSHEEVITINKNKLYIVKNMARNNSTNYIHRGSPFLNAHRASKARIAPQISAAIASYVRIILYNILSQKKDNGLAYTDTDSVILQKPLDEKLISPNKLGLWKHEGSFDTGIFIGKKLYKLWKFEDNTNNLNTSVIEDRKEKLKKNLTNSIIEESKSGAKGIPNSYLTLFKDTDWVDMLTNHLVTKVLLGSIEENRVKMHKDYQKYNVELKPTDISISNSTIDNSRKRVFDLYGNCITTVPHFINETNFITKNETEYTQIYNDLKSKMYQPSISTLTKEDLKTYNLNKKNYYSKKRKKIYKKT